jgi:hypothetical protein
VLLLLLLLLLQSQCHTAANAASGHAHTVLMSHYRMKWEQCASRTWTAYSRPTAGTAAQPMGSELCSAQGLTAATCCLHADGSITCPIQQCTALSRPNGAPMERLSCCHNQRLPTCRGGLQSTLLKQWNCCCCCCCRGPKATASTCRH